MTLKQYIESLKGEIHYDIMPHETYDKYMTKKIIKYQFHVYFTRQLHPLANTKDSIMLEKNKVLSKKYTFNEYFISDDLDEGMFLCERYLDTDISELFSDGDITKIAFITYECEEVK